MYLRVAIASPWRQCASLLAFSKFSTMVPLPLLPSGSSLLVVLQIQWDCANPFFMYLTTTVSSFSSIGAVFNVLVSCECHCNAFLPTAAPRVPVSIASVPIDPLVFQCSAPLVLDSKCLVGINTLYKIAPPVYHPTSMASCSVSG